MKLGWSQESCELRGDEVAATFALKGRRTGCRRPAGSPCWGGGPPAPPPSASPNRAGPGALPSGAARDADQLFLLGPQCESGFPLLPTEAQCPAQGDVLTKVALSPLIPKLSRVSLACHSVVLVPRQPLKAKENEITGF